ncbi:MAG: hypothetical protein U0359_17450 [Byssovorax sp.]
MSYEIIRLVTRDWPATVEALRARGVDFYWREREADEAESREDGPKPVLCSEGPIASCPGWRDPEADWIYDMLRKGLDAESRAACDACFSRLFWDNGSGDRSSDLRGTGCSLDGIWYALAPASVALVLAQLRRLPLEALEAAASAVQWESKYLPTFADFEHHLNNHKDLLEHAAKRRAGLLGLISA